MLFTDPCSSSSDDDVFASSRMTLSDDELIAALRDVCADERRATARIVMHLADVEERRLHLRMACSSMYEFCTTRLGMSEGQALRRIAAARVARRFPIAVEMLANGELHLTTLAMLERYLTQDNHRSVLQEAARKTKAELESFLARRFPRPDTPTQILPTNNSPLLAKVTDWTGSTGGSTLPATHESPRRGRVQPLSPERYEVRFTVDSQTRMKLERARELMSHGNPSGDLGPIIGRALDLLVHELEKQRVQTERQHKPSTVRDSKRGKQRTRTETDHRHERSSLDREVEHEDAEMSGAATASEREDAVRKATEPSTACNVDQADRESGSLSASRAWTVARNGDAKVHRKRNASSKSVSKRRAISRKTRRLVFERDGEQCTFVNSLGERCASRKFLELDHVEPKARGGSDEAANLRLLCRSHNQLAAEDALGRKHVEQAIVRERIAVALDGLTKMGFRKSDVNRVLVELCAPQRSSCLPSLPTLITDAIRRLT